MGVAFDGDFDRCFFFDGAGQFVPGEYVVGLLAAIFLDKELGGKIVHDPRVIWNTQDIVASKGGIKIQSKTGHAFIKQTMRANEAVYGGEMSAHHYFRDFAYCDSGMIPWLLVAGLISSSGQPISKLVAERMAAYPCSGEINRTIENPVVVLTKIEAVYRDQAESVEHVDGLSMSMGEWRFNVRMSNTEPLVRLNVESRGDQALMKEKTTELLALIDA